MVMGLLSLYSKNQILNVAFFLETIMKYGDFIQLFVVLQLTIFYEVGVYTVRSH